MVFLTGAVAVSIFFKPMLEEFGWNRAALSSVQSVALILYTLVSPFLGRLVDRFGPKAMIVGCIGAQVLSRLFNGIANNIWHLYLARFLYGLNVIPAAQVLINRWFIKKRGMALGFYATGVPIGAMVLTPVSQHLILLWGWRATMLFWAGIALVVMLPLALIIKNDPSDKGSSPDGENPETITPMIPVIVQEDADSTEWSGKKSTGLYSETFGDNSFWFLSVGHFICGTGCGFMMTHIVAFVTDIGYSEMIGATVVSMQGAFNLIGLLVTGPLSDRIARRTVLALTHFIRSLSFFIFAYAILFNMNSLWLLYLAIAFFGFGWFTTAPLAAGLIADLFSRKRMGTIIGISMSCHMAGAALGAYAGGAVYDLTQSYFLIFLIQGPLELLAAALALFIRRGNTE
jgi:MFS family permease